MQEKSQSLSPTPFQAIVTERLIVRRFVADDAENFLALRMDPKVGRYQSWEPMDRAAVESFIAGMANADPGVPGQWFQFAIELRATGAFVGDCGLHLLAEDPRQGEMGYTLHAAYHGQGLGQEAVAAVVNYAFSLPNVHRIAAIADIRNYNSIRLLERLGFRREGYTRQAFWNKGEWVDEYLYAML
ncbi:MAG: GNAT family N-acetyltransferase, partial [Caldilineaceae bacterium]